MTVSFADDREMIAPAPSTWENPVGRVSQAVAVPGASGAPLAAR
jgi:hypothetical protein